MPAAARPAGTVERLVRGSGGIASPQILFGREEGDELILDGSFEAGTPNPYWEEASINFGTPICSVTTCGAGGGSGPNTGAWWAWFGGTSEAETSHVAQEVEIPEGSAELSFFLEIPAANTPGWMRVRLGGDLVFEATDSDATAYATYQQVVLDISDHADGGMHEVRFEGQTEAGATTSFFVDDVSLVPTGPVLLSAEPLSGSVAPGEATEITLTASWHEELESGVHEFEVRIQTNDPEAPLLLVGVTVAVNTVGADGGADPHVLALEQNYPNPFPGQTTITYSLAGSSSVRLSVYDVTGRRVATLVDAEQEPGAHSAVWDARGVASGVYFVRIQAGGLTQTLRALVVR